VHPAETLEEPDDPGGDVDPAAPHAVPGLARAQQRERSEVGGEGLPSIVG
jgi:hypothetical protein